MKFSTIDPLNEIPRIKIGGKEIDPAYSNTIAKAIRDLRASEKAKEKDNDERDFEEDENGAFIPVSELRRNKRKERTPEQELRAKIRKSATNEAICRNLRKDSSEESSSDSESSDNETIVENSIILLKDPSKPSTSGTNNKKKKISTPKSSNKGLEEPNDAANPQTVRNGEPANTM